MNEVDRSIVVYASRGYTVDRVELIDKMWKRIKIPIYVPLALFKLCLFSVVCSIQPQVKIAQQIKRIKVSIIVTMIKSTLFWH